MSNPNQYSFIARGKGIFLDDTSSDAFCDVSTLASSGFRFNSDITLRPGSQPLTEDSLITKAYCNASMNGLSFKTPCRLATQSNINLASALIDGFVIDGISAINGDRILVKSQNASAQNGIYVCGLSGAAVRATDSDNSPGAEIAGGSCVAVTLGTISGAKVFIQTNNPIDIGVSDQTWLPLGVANSSQISQGDTTVSVADSGTGAVTVTVDNVEQANFTAASALRARKSIVGSLTAVSSRPLEVVGECLIRHSASDNGGASIWAPSSSGTLTFYGNSNYIPSDNGGANWSAAGPVISSGGISLASLVATGNVSIGTSATTKVLTVNSSDGRSFRQTYNSSGGGTATYYTDYMCTALGDCSLLPYSSRVGINSQGPAENLTVAGATAVNATIGMVYGGGSNKVLFTAYSAGKLRITPTSGQAAEFYGGISNTTSITGGNIVCTSVNSSINIDSSAGGSTLSLSNGTSETVRLIQDTDKHGYLTNNALGMDLVFTCTDSDTTVRTWKFNNDGAPQNSSGFTAWSAVSDQRLKKDIEYLDSQAALDAICQTKPAHFKYKWQSDKDRRRCGWLAQEIQDIPLLASMVTESAPATSDLERAGLEVKKYFQLDSSDITPFLCSAVKALNEKIECVSVGSYGVSEHKGDEWPSPSQGIGEKGEKGEKGLDGRDGKDGKDAVCKCSCSSANAGYETESGFSPLQRLEDENVLLNKRLAALERRFESLTRRFAAASAAPVTST